MRILLRNDSVIDLITAAIWNQLQLRTAAILASLTKAEANFSHILTYGIHQFLFPKAHTHTSFLQNFSFSSQRERNGEERKTTRKILPEPTLYCLMGNLLYPAEPFTAYVYSYTKKLLEHFFRIINIIIITNVPSTIQVVALVVVGHERKVSWARKRDAGPWYFRNFYVNAQLGRKRQGLIYN